MLPFQAAPGQFGPEVRQPGLHVWRVEKMKAVQLDSSMVGAFYNGDSYLVLDNRGDQGVDLHMWIGERAQPHLAVMLWKNKSNCCLKRICILLAKDHIIGLY